MKTVYAIEYDPFNQVIHAVTGSNSYMPSYGLTFSADTDNFGKLLHKWQTSNEVKKLLDFIRLEGEF